MNKPLLALCAAIWATSILTSNAQYSCSTNNGTLTITEYNGADRDVTVPATLWGLPIVDIGDFAFGNQRWITNVVIGNNVTNIGSFAFCDCNVLRTVTVNGAVRKVGTQAFYNCPDLSQILIGDNVIDIGSYALAECPSLSLVFLGKKVSHIGYLAFLNSLNLRVFATGNRPATDGDIFSIYTLGPLYYLPGTTGWESQLGNIFMVLWDVHVVMNDGKFGVRTNRMGFTIGATANLEVIVEASDNPQAGNWEPVGTNWCNVWNNYFSDAGWTNHPSRFYRLRSP